MIEEIISNSNDLIDSLIPSNEEIKNIIDKLNNNEQLTFYENILIDKLRLINIILKNKGGRI